VRSSECAKILGLTEPEPFTYEQFLDGIHPADRSAFLAAVAALTPENPTSEVTYRFLRPMEESFGCKVAAVAASTESKSWCEWLG
jgi:hypothetical protein